MNIDRSLRAISVDRYINRLAARFVSFTFDFVRYIGYAAMSLTVWFVPISDKHHAKCVTIEIDPSMQHVIYRGGVDNARTHMFSSTCATRLPDLSRLVVMVLFVRPGACAFTLMTIGWLLVSMTGDSARSVIALLI